MSEQKIILEIVFPVEDFGVIPESELVQMQAILQPAMDQMRDLIVSGVLETPLDMANYGAEVGAFIDLARRIDQ